YVTFECPSPTGSPVTGPAPSPCASRNASSGRRTSSGGRASAAASSGVSTIAVTARECYWGLDPVLGARRRADTLAMRMRWTRWGLLGQDVYDADGTPVGRVVDTYPF